MKRELENQLLSYQYSSVCLINIPSKYYLIKTKYKSLDWLRKLISCISSFNLVSQVSGTRKQEI